MECLAYSTDAIRAVEIIEKHEQRRWCGVVKNPAAKARQQVSAAVGCSPGTIENLRRGRLKKIEQWLYEAIQRVLAKQIENEIARLTRELANARTRNAVSLAADIGALSRAIAEAEEFRSALTCLASPSRQGN